VIERGPDLAANATVVADLCVVGSGAGGAMVAREAARAGLRVVVLEEGPALAAAQMTQREDDMLPRLFYDAGGRATADGAITVLHGRGLGGSTIHNTNLCKRAPAEVLDAWRVDGWRAADLEDHYRVVEEALSVAPIEDSRINRNNALLRAGAERLGWKHGRLSHNRKGCIGAGFCELGCSFDAKQNAAKVLIPDAVAHGARVITECRAEVVLTERGRAIGVRATTGGRSLEVHAPVCLAGSAIGSALLARKSRLPDPSGKLGRTLRLHPGAAVAGVFREPVEAWSGIPQSWECTELLDFSGRDPLKRIWIVPAFAHPVGMAAMLPGFGKDHMRTMRLYPRLAVLVAMLHDESTGEVGVAGERPRIDYRLDASDARALLHGMRGCAELLFAAGAERVLVPFARPIELRAPTELDRITAHRYRPLDPLLAAVHPMGTLPLGPVVDERGAYRGLDGLWVADGSLFQTSIGGPPQLTIYAAAHKVAGHLVRALGGGS
jgi:choline dehydrogenase-like flavoprotein